MKRTVSFYTLGCKLNFTESSTISAQLRDSGFETVDFAKGADLYVINTCSVTDHADRKCKKVVREALKHNEEAFVVIIGCYAQLKPDEIAEIPGVDMVLGAQEKFNLVNHLSSMTKLRKARIHNQNIKETNIFIPSFSKDERTRSFVKVQDGCDYFCSFCTIPLARGKSRSSTISETVQEIKQVGTLGAKEIVLTGINLGDFGVNHGEDFFGLIQELDGLKEVGRYRISSIEPNLLSNEIIEFVSQSDRFAPHFHIPLQSGNDDILGKMRRRYDRQLYRDRIEKIKQMMPHACIGVDVIVGFPGETNDHFQDTYRFLNELDISYLHVFPYSERVNTTAYKMKDVVPMSQRVERSKMLRILSEKKRRSFYETQIGTSGRVLFEERNKEGWMFGFTENYVKVATPYDPLWVNEFVSMELTHVDEMNRMSAVPLHMTEPEPII